MICSIIDRLWAADSDPNSITTVFRWIIDWAADLDPNSMTFRLGWMIDWAADSDPNWMTTGFGWIMELTWTRAGPAKRIPWPLDFESDGG